MASAARVAPGDRRGGIRDSLAGIAKYVALLSRGWCAPSVPQWADATRNGIAIRRERTQIRDGENAWRDRETRPTAIVKIGANEPNSPESGGDINVLVEGNLRQDFSYDPSAERTQSTGRN